jgi:hypothetical protein
MVLPSTAGPPLWRAVLHGGAMSSPIPGWAALIGGVLGLWIVIGGGVVAVDRLFELTWNR